MESDLIARSPCRGIHLPTRDQKEMRFLDREGVRSLIDAIDPRYSALIAAAAYGGARFGELAALRTSRLDLIRGSMTIVEQLSEVRGEVPIRPPKSPAARRQVALPQVLTVPLAAHLTANSAVDGYVFTSPRGRLLRRTAFRRRFFLPAVRASVGEPMRFHDLRHTHVAMLIAQGEHPKLIQTRIGHSSIQLTLDLYGHLFEGLDEGAAERLDETLTAPLPEHSRNKGPATILEFPPPTAKPFSR